MQFKEVMMSQYLPKRGPGSRAVAMAALIACLAACQDVPKYKKSNGNFDEWREYEGTNFKPSSGSVAAMDTAAGTLTIKKGSDKKVYRVTPQTRIMHEATDIPLAQLPIGQEVKYRLTDDRKTLLSVWYGQHVDVASHPAEKPKNTFF